MPGPDGTDRQLARIADPVCGDIELVRAVATLGPIIEDPRFWLNIANDPSYRASHRRIAIFQLFYRHVRPGMTLAQLGDLVGGQPWLRPDLVYRVGDLGGSIPVRLTFENSVFVIDVLPESSEPDRWLVYISLAGEIPIEAFRSLLGADPLRPEFADSVIIEVGFVPPAIESLGNGP